MMSPTLAPVIMNIAMTRQYSVITAWIVVTVVSKSATRVLIDTFITDWSSTMTNWAVRQRDQRCPANRRPGRHARRCRTRGCRVRHCQIPSAVKPGCPAEPCPSAGRLITRVLRASRSQPVMSVLRSAGPRAPGRVRPVRLRPGPPSGGAPALGIQRRKRGNRGRFCRSSCRSSSVVLPVLAVVLSVVAVVLSVVLPVVPIVLPVVSLTSASVCDNGRAAGDQPGTAEPPASEWHLMHLLRPVPRCAASSA